MGKVRKLRAGESVSEGADKAQAMEAEGHDPETGAQKKYALDTDAWKVWNENTLGIKDAFAWADLLDRSTFLGHPLTVEDLLELHSTDEIPEEARACQYPGCEHSVRVIKSAVVLKSGDLRKEHDESVTYRGSFVALFQKDRSMKAEGFCPRHVIKARQRRNGERLPAQCYAQAQARAKFLPKRIKEQEAQDAQFAEDHGMTASVGERFTSDRSRGGGHDPSSPYPRTERGKGSQGRRKYRRTGSGN
jgi:hypothetical protein